MRTVKLEDTRMGVLAVQHLIKSHVTITTFVTPTIKNVGEKILETQTKRMSQRTSKVSV